MNEYGAIIIIVLFCLVIFQIISFGIYFRNRKISVKGISPVHPVLFITAKSAGLLCWISLFVQATGIFNLSYLDRNEYITVFTVLIYGAGCIFQFISYLNIGHNLKFGIPDENQQKSSTLKVDGLYRYSRNPMYVGFFLMIIASCVYIFNPLIWILSLFTIIVHHNIVLREEMFLQTTFGEEWTVYSKQVRRYL